MRLTNNDYLSDALHLKHKTQYEYNNELWQYVKEREDIEEELGISLVTLIKTLTGTIAIKNEDGTIDVMWACPRFQISIDKSDCWILYGPVEEQKYVSIKDYGKTWALTKEELL